MAILEKETFEKFGYYPSELKLKSNKKILVTCDECGKIREIYKHTYYDFCKSCACKGGRSYAYGKHPSEITKAKMSKAHPHNTGKNSPHWKGGKIKKICQYCGDEFKIDPSGTKRGRGKYCSPSCSRKGRKGFPTHHTKPELIFEQICKKYNLQYKYTGDGSFWIGKNPAVNPDFVECNGKKIAVEIFSYWHDPLKRHCKVPYSQTYEGRKKILKKYNWELVVFWQEDLERKDAEQFVLSTLKKYL